MLDSGVEVSNNAYRIHIYKLSELFELNTDYTLTIWGEAGNGCEFAPYIGGGDTSFGNATKIRDGVYYRRMRRSSWINEVTGEKAELWIFMIGNSDSHTTNTIHRIKLEHSSNPTPIWTPSPYDYNSIYTRLAALETAIKQ